jgi:hypothetical protein
MIVMVVAVVTTVITVIIKVLALVAKTMTLSVPVLVVLGVEVHGAVDAVDDDLGFRTELC